MTFSTHVSKQWLGEGNSFTRPARRSATPRAHGLARAIGLVLGVAGVLACGSAGPARIATAKPEPPMLRIAQASSDIDGGYPA